MRQHLLWLLFLLLAAVAHQALGEAPGNTEVPAWTDADMRASYREFPISNTLPPHPGERESLPSRSLVVERGGNHIAILNDETLDPAYRLPLRDALRGKPMSSPDGRYAFIATQDAWVIKFDVLRLETVAEIRVGLEANDAAISGDGKYVAVVNRYPPSLAFLDANLIPQKVLPLSDKYGKRVAHHSTVYAATPRKSFMVVLQDIGEIWELSYNPAAAEIPVGLIHDFQYREGAFIPGFLNPIRTELKHCLQNFAFSENFNTLIVAPSTNSKGEIVNMDVRRTIESWESSEAPYPSLGFSWERLAHAVIAAPSPSHDFLAVIDMRNGKTIGHAPVPMGTQFVRSRQDSRYLWVGSQANQHQRAHITIIDKDTLKTVRVDSMEPGSSLVDIGFSRDGRRAFVTLAGGGNDVIVYDTKSLNEIRRFALEKIPNTGHAVDSDRRESP